MGAVELYGGGGSGLLRGAPPGGGANFCCISWEGLDIPLEVEESFPVGYLSRAWILDEGCLCRWD
jgi:hypothetical protein